MKINRIRIGVLSTAAISRRSVIPAILNLPQAFEFTGIASRTIESAQQVSGEFECSAFGSYSQILNKEHIDAVYIPLPNSLHYEWVKLALERNIHVLVEKTLACNYDQVLELNQLAKAKQLSLVENFQFRFHQQLQAIQGIIHTGELGELRYIRSSFEFPPFPDSSNIRYQKDLGGGALLDAGAYPIKLSQIILGQNISVIASALRYDGIQEVDLGGGAFLKQDHGNLYAEISFGFDNYYQCSLEVYGSLGKLSTNRIFTSPPGYRPVIQVETQKSGKRLVEIEADNHFVNMLNYFQQTIGNTELQEEEYCQNIQQARLIKEFKDQLHEK